MPTHIGCVAIRRKKLMTILENSINDGRNETVDDFAAAAKGIQPAPLFSRQSIAVTDAGQTLQREFLIRVPLLFPKVTMPAVIAFHGGGQMANKMVEHWISVANQDIVIVCPEALVDPVVHKTLWDVPRPG